MAGRGKPGPTPKGDRRQVTLRVPVEHYSLYRAEADAQGMSLADYLASTLACGHDLPEPPYVDRSRRKHEDTLPLTG